jgi:hypothetical protein
MAAARTRLAERVAESVVGLQTLGEHTAQNGQLGVYIVIDERFALAAVRGAAARRIARRCPSKRSASRAEGYA